MMKKLIILIMACALIADSDAQKSNKFPESQWTSGGILIDGLSPDWSFPLKFYDNSTRISYAIANDSSNIYLCFVTGDETMQMKILRSGMIVGLDTLGKRKQHISISYPRVTASTNPGSGPKVRPGMDELRQNFKYKQQFMELSGFMDQNGISPLQAINGVMVCINWNENGELVYELAIPFQSFGPDFNARAGSTKPFALNVTIPALKFTGSGQGGPPGGSGRPGGGGPPGGVRPGGGSGRPGGGGPPSWVTQGTGGSGYEMLSEEQKFRQKFLFSSP